MKPLKSKASSPPSPNSSSSSSTSSSGRRKRASKQTCEQSSGSRWFLTYLCLVILLSLILVNISVIQAACNNKLQQQINRRPRSLGETMQGESSSSSSDSSETAPNVSTVSATDGNATSSSTTSLGTSSPPTSDEFSYPSDQLSVNDLNDFRLEYNKYKILSHLGITSNPDSMAPNLNEDLRSQLTSISSQYDNSQSTASSRHKRSLTCNQVKDNKDTCCLENFYVNFTYIGWDKWILYPAGYNANYCRGQCDLSHARYYHSTLLSKYSNVISLCCSPKQMAPLRLLYIDSDDKVHQKSIPDMIVESCDCA